MSHLVSMETHTKGGALKDASGGLMVARKRTPGQWATGGRNTSAYATATQANGEWGWVEQTRKGSMAEFTSLAQPGLRLRQFDDGSWQMLDRGRIISEVML